MNTLINKLGKKVKGCITGFDRIVFKGYILPLMTARGAMWFCQNRNILNKNYKEWMLSQTDCLVEKIDQYAKDCCGQGIIPIPTLKIRKEKLAHERQETEKIQEGLIGIWSCLESGASFRSHYSQQAGYPQLQNYQTRCKHIYLYYDHKDYGFMSIRIQTWFPYSIQISLNGREWLRRSLEKEKIEFLAHGNKFFHIANYSIAQQHLDKQMDVRFVDLLNEFVPMAFPIFHDVLGDHYSYYWTLWQSEWATDLILSAPDDLKITINSLLRHAHMTGTSANVLRYMDRPITQAGKPYANCKTDVISRVADFQNGLRVRHWVGNNSVKVYNEQNVLRIETTMNNPGQFKVFRHKQGQNPEEKKTRLPLRKGIADIPLRAHVSQDVNNRFMNNLASFQDDAPVYSIIDKVTRAKKCDSRKFRALDPTGKDHVILKLISSPEFVISGFANKMLRRKMKDMGLVGKMTEKQLSAYVSRYFRLLREHGIIRKIPNQNRYLLSDKGGQLTVILSAFMSSSINQLIKLAA